MERYPLSTHSRELEITGCVFALAVLGLSYAVTLEQKLIGSTLHSLEHRLGVQSEVTSGTRPEVSPSRTVRSLGHWRIHERSVVNENGAPVRLNGINWSGCETSNKVPGGLDHQDYKAILDAIRRAGFNLVRIPLSNAMIENPIVPTAIAFNANETIINGDLRGMNSLQILDKVIAYSGSIGLRIVLDDHRSTAGGGPQENGFWFTDEFPETSWLDDWLTLARRYREQDAVIGFDLRNEPHSVKGGGACWGCGGDRDWHLAAERAGNLILAEDSSKLIVIEGVDVYEGDASWWGGNLEGVKKEPVQLSLPDHVIYSAHEYGPVEHAQPWLNADTTPTSLQKLWDRRWGFIEEQGIAPVFVGEFGTVWSDLTSGETAGSQEQWFAALMDYLQTRPHIGWSYWSANAEDRYAFFQSDYMSERAETALLKRLIDHGKEFSQGNVSWYAGSRKEPLKKDPCGRSYAKPEETSACPVWDNHSPHQARGNRALDHDIAENIHQATRNAVRTLPSEHP